MRDDTDTMEYMEENEGSLPSDANRIAHATSAPVITNATHDANTDTPWDLSGMPIRPVRELGERALRCRISLPRPQGDIVQVLFRAGLGVMLQGSSHSVTADYLRELADNVEAASPDGATVH